MIKQNLYTALPSVKSRNEYTNSALVPSLDLRSATANSAAEHTHSDPMLPPVVLLLGATRLLVGFTLTEESGIESFLATT